MWHRHRAKQGQGVTRRGHGMNVFQENGDMGQDVW